MSSSITRNGGRPTRRERPGASDGAAATGAVMLALVLALVLALALALGAAGCGSSEVTRTTAAVSASETVGTTTSTGAETSTTAVSESSTTAGSSSTTASSTTTTTEPLSSAETRLSNGHIRAMGYIDKVWESGGMRHISIDYAEMLTGDEAKAAAIAAGEIAPGEDLPNDYFIRNTNPLRREFTVSATAPITTATFGGGMDQPVTWAQFMSFWSASPPAGGEHLHDVPWWIERDGGEVVSISEQYLP
jgi:hypothetical protein